MKSFYLAAVVFLFFFSCSTKNQLVYLGDSETQDYNIVDYPSLKNYIEVGDILKIDVQTIVPNAAIPYNKKTFNEAVIQNLNILNLEGYIVDEFKMIKFPVLGDISVDKITLHELESVITQLLLEGRHLTNPTVKVRRVNSKFTILGEVRSPGTFPYFDEKLNIFQALGYAGDLTIEGKRNEITLIREQAGLRAVYKFSLTKYDLLKKPYYHIRNNDVIIVEPSFSKVKSAGFIGSPSSIASISSLLLSITLLIINK